MYQIQICASRKQLQIFFRCEFIAITLIWNALRSGSMRWCQVFMGFWAYYFCSNHCNMVVSRTKLCAQVAKPRSDHWKGEMKKICTQARKMVCVLATHMASSLGWIVTCSSSSFLVKSRNMAGRLGRAIVAPFFYQPSAERHSFGPWHSLILWTGSARYCEAASRWVEWQSEKRVG